MLTDQDSSIAMNAFVHSTTMVQHAVQDAVAGYGEPSAIYRPKISIDGSQWCALYGDNLQDGVAGFGNSPSAAMQDFNKQWYMPLKSKD